MEQKKEAVYLINDERYLHLRENGAGVGFATYNKVTGEPLESGQISEKNLPPDGQNTIPAARNWYLFELSDDDRKAIQQESVKILENIPQAAKISSLEIDRLVVLYYSIIFHQQPPSNSKLNLLRPSTSVLSSTVAL